MNPILDDSRLIQKYSPAMNGVFSVFDLKNLFMEKDPVSANRRINRLVKSKVITRFTRGFYSTPDVSLERLAARIHENSYLSGATTLEYHLMIGTRSIHTVYAVKPGRPVSYQGSIGRVIYMGIKADLFFGYTCEGDLRYASPEKSLLDTLYFYQKGRRWYFNIFEDIDLSKVNRGIVKEYLAHYRNPRFTAFAERYLDERLP